MLSKKILIIDDEPDVNTYLEAVLKSNGYETYSISEVENAMEKVKEIHPRLICLDIMMPKETGISFYSKLRKDKKFSKIPVIIISGVVESEKFSINSFVSDKSIPAPECYMEKPINVENFIKKVKQLTN
ncbi:MAG: response regulator [Ignavibacteriaceae bacterium]